LYDKLAEFIDDVRYDKIIVDDLLITAWDYNSRTPYLFTKDHVKTNQMKKFDSVLKTTYFSACNPMYFKPCKEG
jgi:hypothetical protein